jgi:hypothetical protein
VWTYKFGGEVPPDNVVQFVSLLEIPMSAEEIRWAEEAIKESLRRLRPPGESPS